MSKRILYFDHWKSATEYYRLYPLDYIDTVELTIVRSTENNPTWALLDSFDTIIISRPSKDTSVSLIKLAKQMHKKVIADFDDGVLNLDQYNPMYSYYNSDKGNIIRCLSLADEIWVATDTIRNSFRLYNKNIHVVPNGHQDYIFPVRNKKEFTHNKCVTWRGGYSHLGDMYEIGTPEMIIKMVNGNPDWSFKFVGQRLEYIEKRCGKNYLVFGGNDNNIEFYRTMHESNSQIFFYPLSDTVFNRSKSNCSWLEASYSGSAFFGNMALPEFQKPGISDLKLLPKAVKEDHWKYCKEQNELSWAYIKENLLVSKINELRIERLLQ